jgi:GNAT superfamily N-acetyltransferase
VLDQPIRLDGREAVLAAAGDNPYTRMTTTGAAVTGFRTGRAVAWLGQGPESADWTDSASSIGRGPMACAFGDAAESAQVFATLAEQGRLDEVRWLHLPRLDGTTLAPHLRLSHQDDWDFRWTSTPPPPVAGEDRMIALDDRDGAEITALLDEAHPSSTTRPGDPRVGRWYGIRDGDRLVACGADRSLGEVAFLAGLTVATDYQGRGLGAALTAGMTRLLFRGYGVVSLGVMWDNTHAIRLYERLGFTATLARSSVLIN